MDILALGAIGELVGGVVAWATNEGETDLSLATFGDETAVAIRLRPIRLRPCWRNRRKRPTSANHWWVAWDSNPEPTG